MRRRRVAALLALAACAGAPAPAGMPGIELAAGQVAVVVFVATDCPIADAYTPELRALAAEFAVTPVRWFLVHAAAAVDADRARTHAREFALPGTVVLDRELRLAQRLGATVTPQAFVVLADGTIAYEGRIDDAWADLGVRRQVVRSHELRDALAAVVAGRLPAVRRTEAVGCVIER